MATGSLPASVANRSSTERIVLLFCHGGSYTKHCWSPIIRRLQESSLLQRVPSCEIASFNWRFHGDKRDHSTAPTVYYQDGNKSSPRVDHPVMKWPEWAPPDLELEIAMLRKDDAVLARRTRIIGIGHSMGATVLIQVETSMPGTLDGIIAFEPVYNDGSLTTEANSTIQDLLVSGCLAREGEWDTRDDLQRYLKTSRAFRRWHPEALAAFVEQGVEKSEDGKRLRLVMSPSVEASLYCHELVHFSVDDFARMRCKIILERAERTVFFNAKPALAIAERLPGQFIVADAIPNTTHGMVIEEPAACAQHILEGLPAFQVFQEAMAIAKL